MRRQTLEAKAGVDVVTGYAGSAQAGRVLSFRTPAPTFYRRRGKRLLDFTFAALLFLGLLPITAAIALAILLTSGWPLLYAADRVGKDGRRFRLSKFRTMVRDADEVLELSPPTGEELIILQRWHKMEGAP